MLTENFHNVVHRFASSEVPNRQIERQARKPCMYCCTRCKIEQSSDNCGRYQPTGGSQCPVDHGGSTQTKATRQTTSLATSTANTADGEYVRVANCCAERQVSPSTISQRLRQTRPCGIGQCRYIRKNNRLKQEVWCSQRTQSLLN